MCISWVLYRKRRQPKMGFISCIIIYINLLISVFSYGNHNSPPNRCSNRRSNWVAAGQTKSHVTNHVTEGWELNLLPSHSWCNALGCVYPLQSFLTRVLEKMPFANLLCCVSPLEGERVLSKLTGLPLLKLEIFWQSQFNGYTLTDTQTATTRTTTKERKSHCFPFMFRYFCLLIAVSSIFCHNEL